MMTIVFLRRAGTVLFLIMLSCFYIGCGNDSTGPGPDDGNGSLAADYFVPATGYNAYFKLTDSVGDSIGVTRFHIPGTFLDTTGLAGFLAVDSTFQGVDTFWLVTTADTVFRLERGDRYAQRRPVVRNHTQTDFSWPLYSVGTFGMPDYYTVFFHQLPDAEMVQLTTGRAYFSCGRTDLLAVYQQSGDTISLGSEYFGPTIGRGWVLNFTRPFVESEIFYRELIE